MFHDGGAIRTATPKRARKGETPKGALKRQGRAFGHPFSRRLSPEVMHRVVLDYLEALDTPVSLSVWLLYKHSEMRQLVEKSIDPHNYEETDSWQRDYAAVKFLSKCAGLKTGINVDEVAIDTAQKAEDQCRNTNHEIRRRRLGVTPDFYASEYFRARSMISRILGPCPQNLVDLDPGWSSGRTTSAFGLNLTALEKYGSQLDVTRSARRYASQFLRDCPHWGAAAIKADGPCSVLHAALNEVSGNVMLVVPKNAKTGRVICYEPHVNIRLQLAVGGHIRRRLARAGVDLSDQSINQRRASLGSLHGTLATIDLRSASDTVALELVWELLPYDWACLLDDLRSKYTTWPDGSVRRNEKFSSMGNGYTFELESLIFYALAMSVSTDVTVYGDDLIVPTNRAEQVTNLLSWSGFTVNSAKSYSSSWFRESCGEDRFRGVRSTPAYLRRPVKAVKDVLTLHNRVSELREQIVDSPTAMRLTACLSHWRNMVPYHHGPKGFGDGHYHAPWDASAPSAAYDRQGLYVGLEGYWFKSTVAVFPHNQLDEPDRLVGEIPDSLREAALCVATGPKRAKSLWDSLSDRRQVVYRTIRMLSGPLWGPDAPSA